MSTAGRLVAATPETAVDKLAQQLRLRLGTAAGAGSDDDSLLGCTVRAYRTAASLAPEAVPPDGGNPLLLDLLANYLHRHQSAPLTSEIVMLGRQCLADARRVEHTEAGFQTQERRLMDTLGSLSGPQSSFLWDDAVSVVGLRIWAIMRREWDAGQPVERYLSVGYVKSALRNEHHQLLSAHTKRTARHRAMLQRDAEPGQPPSPDDDERLVRQVLTALRVLSRRTRAPKVGARQVAAFMNRLAGDQAQQELATQWGVTPSAITHDVERAADACCLVLYLTLVLAPPQRQLTDDAAVSGALELLAATGAQGCSTLDRLVLNHAGPTLRLRADQTLRADAMRYLLRLRRSTSRRAAALTIDPAAAVSELHGAEERYAQRLPGAEPPVTFWCVMDCRQHQPGRTSHGR